MATLFVLLGLVYNDFKGTVNNEMPHYTKSPYGYDLLDEGIININKFDMPFFFVFSMHNDDASIDIIDNPYIEIKLIEYTTGGKLIENKDVLIQKCTQE